MATQLTPVPQALAPEAHVTAANSRRIAILGLGNLMRTDDAVGMLLLTRIANDPRFPADIALIEGGALGLDLLHDLHGVTHLLTLDTVDIGAQPGGLSRFSGAEMSTLPTSKSVHLLGFSDLINVLRLMDAAPEEVVLLGVQPSSTGWGTELTPAVAAAQPALIELALQQITLWTAPAPAAIPHPSPPKPSNPPDPRTDAPRRNADLHGANTHPSLFVFNPRSSA
ncbi:MAG: hydrogenase maturation protease [Acidobacteriaceae bacterium]|jgi:hydrogenase maturation protease